jgi:hypothetical protein
MELRTNAVDVWVFHKGEFRGHTTNLALATASFVLRPRNSPVSC